MRKNYVEGVFLKKVVVLLFAFISSFFVVSEVKAATLTYDEDYKKTGYHLEEYDSVHCIHSQGNSTYVSVESSGLQTSIPVIQSSFRNYSNIPGYLEFRDKYISAPCDWQVSKIQTLFYITAPIGNPNSMISLASGYNGSGTPYVRLTEPYVCSMDGHAGYSYYRAYFSYCSKSNKYFYCGDQHVYYECTAGEIGENMTAVFSFEHDLTRYLVTPNDYFIDFNGNNCDEGSMSTIKCTYDSSVKLTGNAFKRKGYTFSGWNTEPDGSGVSYNDCQTILNLTSSQDAHITLYAQWTPNIYYISFNGAGSREGSMSTIKCTYDTPIVLPVNQFKRYFNLSYDANGGNCNKSSERVYSTFLNWKNGNRIYSDGSTVLNLSSLYGDIVNLSAQWKDNSVKLPVAMKFCYAFVGWDYNGTIYKDNFCPDKDMSFKAVYDRPIVFIAPTDNNTFFDNNGIRYYKENIELIVKGYDKYFPLDNVYINLPGSSDYSAYTSPHKLYINSKSCDSDDRVFVKAKSSILDKKIYSTEVPWKGYIDHTAPELTAFSDVSKNILVKTSDKQSGVKSIKLQYLYNNILWVDYTTYETKEEEYTSCEHEFNIPESDYNLYFRAVTKDHVGNVSKSDGFYVLPLELHVSLSRLNEYFVGDGETLDYKIGGNLNGTLSSTVSGFPDSISYEYGAELKINNEEYSVNCNSDGVFKEDKNIVIPEGFPIDTKIPITVTAKRKDETVTSVVYLALHELDYSKIHSRIRYQSGMK